MYWEARIHHEDTLLVRMEARLQQIEESGELKSENQSLDHFFLSVIFLKKLI